MLLWIKKIVNEKILYHPTDQLILTVSEADNYVVFYNVYCNSISTYYVTWPGDSEGTFGC